ncbi:hypothetical protein BGZ47_003425, partial [Haplosporangium gracile]
MLMEWGTRIGIATYDIEADVWSGKGVGTGVKTGFFGYQAATDPNTGLVYIPSAMNNFTRMMVYNFTTRATTLAPMPSVKLLKLPVGKYAWVWNGVRQSMLLHGGANYKNFEKPYANPNLLEFLPTTSTWRRLTTAVVGALHGICPRRQQDGGVRRITPPPPDNSQFRRNMACTTAGNNFVVWGGQSFNATFLDTAVFDLRSNQWTTQFFLDTPTQTPISAAPVESPTPTKTGDDANSENSINNVHRRTISIIVGVASSLGILIIGACIWFCLRRRRHNNGGTGFNRIQNVNINNKPKRASKRWSGRGPANNPHRDPQEARSLQHQLFEQERRSQEKSVSRSNSEKSDSVQLLSPMMTDNSETIMALSSEGRRISQERWLRRQREEVNQERQALAEIHMQQLEYQRQMDALRIEAYTR